jgi:uncharacterized protein YuzE
MNKICKFRIISIPIVFILLFNFVLESFALSGSLSIDITYNGIIININGTVITLRDAGENIVYPFVSEGTTYLPIRGVASAFNMEVSYDNTKNIVYLTTGTSNDETNNTVTTASTSDSKVMTSKTITITYCGIVLYIDGKRTSVIDSDGLKHEPFIYNGTVFLPLRALANTLGKNVDYDSKANTVFISDKEASENNDNAISSNNEALVEKDESEVSTPKANIKFYKKSTVPMLENITKVPCSKIERLSNDICIYMYGLKDLSSFKMSKYFDYLEDNDFILVDSLTNSDGFTIYIYDNEDNRVVISIIVDSGISYSAITVGVKDTN